MMIQTVKQLNTFIAQNGVESPRLIVPALIEKKEVISFQMAKLVTEKQINPLL